MPFKLKGVQATRDITYFVGYETYHSPIGWRVFIDTSWSNTGNTIAVKAEDVIVVQNCSPSKLGEIRVRNGAKFLIGDEVYRMLSLVYGDYADKNNWLGLKSITKKQADVEIVIS